MAKFRFIPQRDNMDCGPACLAMIANRYGKNYPIEYLRDECFLTREGVSFITLSEEKFRQSWMENTEEGIALSPNIVSVFVPVLKIVSVATCKYVLAFAVRKRAGNSFSISEPNAY